MYVKKVKVIAYRRDFLQSAGQEVERLKSERCKVESMKEDAVTETIVVEEESVEVAAGVLLLKLLVLDVFHRSLD